MFQFPGFAFIPLFYSENKYLLLISASPKTAQARPLQDRPKPSILFPEPPGVNPKLVSDNPLFGITEIEGGFPHSEIHGSKPVRGSP